MKYAILRSNYIILNFLVVLPAIKYPVLLGLVSMPIPYFLIQYWI